MIPKFSIRQLLWGMVMIGLLSLCMSSAARGNRIAFGISVAVVGAIIPLLVYAVVHWASFVVAIFLRLISNRRSDNAKKQPPAMVGIPPDSDFKSVSEQAVGSDSSQGANDV